MEVRQRTRAGAGSGGRPANVSLRELFREVAGLPAGERERILDQRRVSATLRADLESLLRYDSATGGSLGRRVSAVAEEAVHWKDGPVSRCCGPYRLVRLLGSGGMGAVYLAERRDGELEQKVAIKLLRADADRPAWRERFLRERQFLAYVNHPSIARLLDVGHAEDGRPYLVMEYVDGIAIDTYAAPLDLRSQLRLFLLVCDGVSHAHGRLIVHRDLKPSNILVDSTGCPKLLDFGIAKLLDMTAEQTRTVERLLTPSYASPEQLRGDAQNTATDIYSLGAVLYKLLTGRPPSDLYPAALTMNQRLAENGVVAVLSRLSPKLPRDIEHILNKALRYEPAERYSSVEAFANDIRAFLESRPVQARSADKWYRARKFLRRHGGGVAAAIVTSAGLLAGLGIANHQREVAEERFHQVRQLATKVLSLDEAPGGLSNGSNAMHEIVAMSTRHLEALMTRARKDQSLALEVGDAYSLLARAQGIDMASGPVQRINAEQSLRKANIFVEPIVNANPANRKALLTAARISHDRMVLAENASRNGEAVAEGRRTVAHLNRFVELGEPSPAEREIISELYYGVALSHKNQYLAEDGIRYARRSIELSRSSPNALRLSLGLSMLADLLRLTGDLEGALAAIREARAALDNARFPTETERRSAWCRVLGREGKILGAASGLSLNRTDEAIAVIQRAYDLLKEWARNEPESAFSRLLFGSLGREFGDVLRLRHPEKALAVYDHSLLRIREVTDNQEARRGEVELLAGSAYALRRLNRNNEAKERIGAAFRLLGEIKDYPADRIAPHTAAYEALRASGDHLAETVQPRDALRVYEDLLEKVMASNPDTKNDLRHAVAMSHIYGSLAGLYCRNGQRDSGEAYAALRVDLWAHWDRKLPGNSFIRRELESARKQKSSRVLNPDLASQR
jgi:serine/threonine protein kinase